MFIFSILTFPKYQPRLYKMLLVIVRVLWILLSIPFQVFLREITIVWLFMYFINFFSPQDCGKLIFLEDIKRIISFGGDKLKKAFCAVALQHHVSSNIGKLSYCRTPDCQMIYRITKEGSEYICPNCKNSTCTR